MKAQLSILLLAVLGLSIAHPLFPQEMLQFETLNKTQIRRISETYLESGIGAMESDSIEAAIEWFKKSTDLMPDNFLAHYYSGLCHEKIPDQKAAYSSYNMAIASNPLFREALFSRGVLTYKSGKFENAIRDFEKVLTIENSETEAVYFRGFKSSNNEQQATLDQIMTVDKLNADVYNYVGLCYVSIKNNNKAIEAYNKAIKLDSLNDVYYVNRGVFSLNIYDTASAQSDFQKAIILNPENELAVLNHSLVTTNNPETIINTLSTLIEANPSLAISYQQRGYQYFISGNYQAAIDDYSKSIEMVPLDELNYIDRGLAYERIEKNEKALADYQKARSINPLNEVAWRGLGNVYFKQKEYLKSIECFSESIKIDSAYAPVFYNRGLSYFYAGELTKACIDMNTSINLGYDQSLIFLNKYCDE